MLRQVGRQFENLSVIIGFKHLTLKDKGIPVFPKASNFRPVGNM
jgi:hypothetical protein